MNHESNKGKQGITYKGSRTFTLTVDLSKETGGQKRLVGDIANSCIKLNISAKILYLTLLLFKFDIKLYRLEKSIMDKQQHKKF